MAADVLGRALAVNLVTVGLEEGKEPGWCTQDEMVMAPHTAPRPRFQSNCALSLVVNKLDMEAVRCHTGGLQCWGKNYTQHSEVRRPSTVARPPAALHFEPTSVDVSD